MLEISSNRKGCWRSHAEILRGLKHSYVIEIVAFCLCCYVRNVRKLCFSSTEIPAYDSQETDEKTTTLLSANQQSAGDPCCRVNPPHNKTSWMQRNICPGTLKSFKAVVEEMLRSFTSVKVVIPQSLNIQK